MVEGIIGKKRGMTQVFDKDGKRVPVTVIEAGPCRVVQVKTRASDGYEAIQLGFGATKRPNKPEKQHAAKANVAAPEVTREFRPVGAELPAPGQEINVSIFQEGDVVDVRGVTKGKGFQGVVRRHNFAGGPGSRGSTFHRAPGAIGCRTWPGRVHKGKRMGGHMGSRNRTVKNLVVVGIMPENNVILLRGSIPGAVSGIVEIWKSRKGGK